MVLSFFRECRIIRRNRLNLWRALGGRGLKKHRHSQPDPSNFLDRPFAKTTVSFGSVGTRDGKNDPVDLLLRAEDRPTGAVVVEANWRDNPWWPAVLEQERQDCLRNNPAQYDHIWEGGYAKIVSGAYYAREIAELSASGRLGRVARDPLMTLRAFWDIGGTGQKADACSIWIGQYVGREIRVLDYYEARGQPLSSHVDWLRRAGHSKALCILPHDGDTNDRVFDVSYESYLREAGFEVQVIQNQGKGAALKRVEATRRLFPSIWVNEETTKAGMDALGAYHAKIDEHRQVDLGPEHDWASHAADAFGLMCVVYEQPQENSKQWERRPQRWIV
jgi:phage terminase large subunit